MIKPMTVKELRDACEYMIKEGFGDKHVLISRDDECNGYHGLWYGFDFELENIKDAADTFHNHDDPNEVILLT